MTEYRIECLRGDILTASGDKIIILDKKKQETVLSISDLKAIHLRPPPKSQYFEGLITLVMKDAPPPSYYTFRKSGLTVPLEKENTRLFVYAPGWAKEAQEFYDYVLGVLKGGVPQEAPAGVSFADELVKLKTLLDQGALTQEEFDLAKKKLLNL